MLDLCAPLARWADVFCDVGAFSVDEARAILLAALVTLVSRLRLHANQLGDSGGVALASNWAVASVDHCTYVSDGDIEALSSSARSPRCCRARSFQLVRPILRVAGCSMRASRLRSRRDCNPGSSYVTSMPFVIALAVREMAMSVDEALWPPPAAGPGVRRDDVGHLGIGARADFVFIDAPRAAHLAYRPGGVIVSHTFRASRTGLAPGEKLTS